MEIVLIPAYEPDTRLVELCAALRGDGFGILVVDDGSGPAYDAVFDGAAAFAEVVRCPENRGKGAALRTGFAAVRERFPDCGYVITADADGQHAPGDIRRMRERCDGRTPFILATRALGGDMPARSLWGNLCSRLVYALAAHRWFEDDQCGLRAMRSDLIDTLLRVRGDRYDYELAMLCVLEKTGVRIGTLSVDRIYFDGNSTSHFRPLEDTLLIYRRFFGTAWPALAQLGLRVLAALVCGIVLGYRYLWLSVLGAGVLAGAASCALYALAVLPPLRYRDAGRELLWSSLTSGANLGICALFGALLPAVPMPLVFLLAGGGIWAGKYFLLELLARRAQT